jgi:fumarate hydratase class II
VLQLAAGGTAVGTGLNAHPVRHPHRRRTGAQPAPAVPSADNKFAALAGHDALLSPTAR